ncbi:hypothetical protein MTR67_039355, partial [Solanum verrucosum]
IVWRWLGYIEVKMSKEEVNGSQAGHRDGIDDINSVYNSSRVVEMGAICIPQADGNEIFEASKWLAELPNNSITSEEELIIAFNARFFPPLRMMELRDDIQGFKRWEDEPIHETWVRLSTEWIWLDGNSPNVRLELQGTSSYPINMCPHRILANGFYPKLMSPVYLRQVGHLFTVWSYMTPDSMICSHGLCRLNTYSYHARCALWFLEEFYKVWVVVWDSIYTLHE